MTTRLSKVFAIFIIDNGCVNSYRVFRNAGLVRMWGKSCSFIYTFCSWQYIKETRRTLRSLCRWLQVFIIFSHTFLSVFILYVHVSMSALPFIFARLLHYVHGFKLSPHKGGIKAGSEYKQKYVGTSWFVLMWIFVSRSGEEKKRLPCVVVIKSREKWILVLNLKGT